MESGFTDGGSGNPVRSTGIAGECVHADGSVGKKFSNESRKRPRSLRYFLLCEQSGRERRKIQNGFLLLARQLSALRPVAPGNYRQAEFLAFLARIL